MNTSDKNNVWEQSFIDKKEMWGFEPATSAILTKDFFLKKDLRKILIPGIGYGRNAQVFRENGMHVTGIEISKTAIDMAGRHYGKEMKIFHGSALDMPFDHEQYDGIFCHALIHLFDIHERQKLVRDCYNQLREGGYMFFSAISKKAHSYGQGKQVGVDRFEIFDGVKMFFYDHESIHAEFDDVGLFEIEEIIDSFHFFLIKCRKRDENDPGN